MLICKNDEVLYVRASKNECRSEKWGLPGVSGGEVGAGGDPRKGRVVVQSRVWGVDQTRPVAGPRSVFVSSGVVSSIEPSSWGLGVKRSPYYLVPVLSRAAPSAEER